MANYPSFLVRSLWQRPLNEQFKRFIRSYGNIVAHIVLHNFIEMKTAQLTIITNTMQEIVFLNENTPCNKVLALSTRFMRFEIFHYNVSESDQPTEKKSKNFLT